VNPQIFREYDIRGIADRDLTDEAVRAIGRAFAQRARERNGIRIAVGRDVRLSSPRIRASLIEGLRDQGAEVIDVGEVPTPALYFAILHLPADAGVMVTGSHNPIEYNGLKLSDGVCSLHGPEIQELRARAERAGVLEARGGVEEVDVNGPYLQDLLSRVKIGRGLKVVVDPGNGAASILGPKFLRALGCEVDAIFAEPDGRFPNHLPDPTVPELMRSLQARVVATGADLGIGFDGDADRVGAVDEKGRLLYGDQLLALYAADVLAARLAHLIGRRRTPQQLYRPIGTLVDTVDEIAGLSVENLERNTSYCSRNNRTALPKRLGHYQTKALAQGFLDHDVGCPLESVYLPVTYPLQIGQQMDIVILSGMPGRALVV